MEKDLRHEGSNETLLPKDDDSINKDLNLKPVHPPCCKDALLSAGHVALHSQDITAIAGEMPCRKEQLGRKISGTLVVYRIMRTLMYLAQRAY